MSKTFTISGGQTLRGTYAVQGNKNAALPLIAAVLPTQSLVHLERTPKIADVLSLLQLLEPLGVTYEWNGDVLTVDSRNFHEGTPPLHLVEKLRGSILLLSALAPIMEVISWPIPGGCPIGRRSFDIHWDVFRSAGFEVSESADSIEMRRVREVDLPQVYLKESSVTATENALILFSALGQGVIENPAREPHVLSLVDFLREFGCQIDLHPLYYRVRSGLSLRREPLTFQVPADFIDAGTIAIAAAVTGSQIELEGLSHGDFWPIRRILEQFSVHFQDRSATSLTVQRGQLLNPSRLMAGLWPSFPTDLVSLAIILATQGKGLCLIHDWMYEARMFFVDKLVRMGANITMCDPHRVLVEGPRRLRGTHLESPDIRAGMALVVAGLCARGTTVIEHVDVIERGYENVAQRLREIGAKISEE